MRELNTGIGCCCCGCCYRCKASSILNESHIDAWHAHTYSSNSPMFMFDFQCVYRDKPHYCLQRRSLATIPSQVHPFSGNIHIIYEVKQIFDRFNWKTKKKNYLQFFFIGKEERKQLIVCVCAFVCFLSRSL